MTNFYKNIFHTLEWDTYATIWTNSEGYQNHRELAGFKY